MGIQEFAELFLNHLTRSGKERGAQLAVYWKGELIVSAVSGISDIETGDLVDRETLFPVYSVTKGITSTIAHQIVEKGLIHYDTRLADIWPEFGANAKSDLTFRHALTHTAGLPDLPPDVLFHQLLVWEEMCEMIARMPPLLNSRANFRLSRKDIWMDCGRDCEAGRWALFF